MFFSSIISDWDPSRTADCNDMVTFWLTQRGQTQGAQNLQDPNDERGLLARNSCNKKKQFLPVPAKDSSRTG